MVALEYVELVSVGDLGNTPNATVSDICLLTDFSPSWRLPMNFTCSSGMLRPHLGLV
jgi:hypothetical protein